MCIRDRLTRLSKNLKHTHLNHIQYNNMTSTTNQFDALFTHKDLHATERSLRAHKGVLTKLTCYIDTAVNAVKILPTAKGA